MTSPVIIAEVGSNHDGDRQLAVELVAMAADAGADAVKFQLFRAMSLYPRNVGVVDTPAGPRDFHALLESLELPVDWLPELKEAADAARIGFMVSPFDEQAVADVASVGVAAVKIASPELTHLPLLASAASTGLPLLVSTGMGTLGDIEEALAVLGESARARTTLMQCTTAYPTPEQDANVGAIPVLSQAFGLPVGLSDHTLDPTAAPLVAAAVGAAAIEKHVTPDRGRDGPDHPTAIEPNELAALVTAVRALSKLTIPARRAAVDSQLGAERVATLLGTGHKSVQPSEAMLAGVDRRAIHALRTLEPGHVVAADDVAILRGERNLRPGLHPRHLQDVIGTRLTRRVDEGDGLVWDDLLARSGS